MDKINFIADEGVELPKYATKGSSGMDVTAVKILQVFRGDREIDPENLEKVQESFEVRGYIKLRSLERILFGTGLKATLPTNTELQVRSRSGMALKRGLCVLNSPGTIDEDYYGEIGVILYNSTPFLNKVDKGERIAQLVSMAVLKPTPCQSDSDVFEGTSEGRGSSGFGSTGTH